LHQKKSENIDEIFIRDLSHYKFKIHFPHEPGGKLISLTLAAGTNSGIPNNEHRSVCNLLTIMKYLG
jgi:hypothetical protein